MSFLGGLFSNNKVNKGTVNNKTYVNNSNRPTRLVSLTCARCGGKLDLDLDHLSSYCPYCGDKLMIDTDQLGMILAEKEETKRHQMDIEYKERKEQLEFEERKHDDKTLLIIIVPCFVILFLILLSTFFH